MGDKFGLAFSDFSTGEFYITEIEKAPQLLDEINKLVPAEIIANEYFFMSGIDIRDVTKRLNIAVSILPNADFNEDSADHEINERTGSSLEDLGLKEFQTGIMAAGALISYMKETQKSMVGHIISVKKYNPDRYMVIDSSTLRNLELVETMRDRQKRGSLLGVLDKTKTAMGKRLLRKMIEQPILAPKEINARLDAVEVLIKSPIDREELREYLDPIHDMERLLTKISCKTASPRELVSLLP